MWVTLKGKDSQPRDAPDAGITALEQEAAMLLLTWQWNVCLLTFPKQMD